MTEAQVFPQFTCSEAGCEIASGGACLDGFESATICPHATETAGPGDGAGRSDEADPETGETSEGLTEDEDPDLERPVLRTEPPVLVPGEEALTLGEAGGLMAKHRVTMVLVAGEADVGKTTLVAELFARFLAGPFNGWSFGGSETLRAFHIRLHPSLASSGAGTPTTERTADEEMRFLHLTLARDGNRHEVLASDGKGEYFENLIEHGGIASEVPIAGRADRCVVAVNGERLNNPRLRDSTIHRARLLLMALTGPGGVPAGCPIALLCTKWDKVGTDESRSAARALLDELAASCGREVAVMTATVRPGPDIEGLEELLDFVAPTNETPPASAGAERRAPAQNGEGRHFWRALETPPGETV
ncbi:MULTISPECIES: TRAFAC clade GTPase domain-containing protein [unclassified Nocardioides]|uniref:TRAFAC clade GTPase domain-containing protein n=1 Tax=unclassified Nocardioides TaxID=2615069 RepID=UPI0030148DA1